MSKSIKQVSDFEQYRDHIRKSSCVVKFTAEWCGPCKRVGPTYSQLATEHGEKVDFLEINIDLASKITNYEDVRSIPLFLFYHKGTKLDDLKIKEANEKTLILNVKAFVEKAEENKHEEVEVESCSDVVILPEQTQKLDMARLVLDDVNDSNSDLDPDELANDHGNNSDYGEDCDRPIEKTIPEDMIKENGN